MGTDVDRPFLVNLAIRFSSSRSPLSSMVEVEALRTGHWEIFMTITFWQVATDTEVKEGNGLARQSIVGLNVFCCFFSI